MAFIESHYTPYIIAHLVNEGIDLTRMLIGLSQFFEKKVVEATIPETTQSRTQRRIVSTDSIRKNIINICVLVTRLLHLQMTKN